jgi:DNA recombination protein RmuC
MTDQTIIYSLLILSVFVNMIILYLFIKKNNRSFSEEKLSNYVLKSIFPLFKEKYDTDKSEIRADIKDKKDSIENIVESLYKEMRRAQRRIEDAERERVGSFRELNKELQNQREMTKQLSATTENLKKILSNNQLRGQFGEQVAENLLKMSGFVKGTDYDMNKAGDTGTRPDFSVYMPDGKKINIDSKFPYANLQKMLAAEDKQAKKDYMKKFESDIKDKIKQVSTRDYINPEENTVDFVILFIPNEMIFSFIYDKMNDIWADAMKKKVVLAGPFSFTAILRMVRQAYDNFKYQENTQKIIGLIKQFEKQFDKYNEEFSKIGSRIDSLQKQYNKVDGTRSRQLVRIIDKIKLDESDSDKHPILEES